MSISSPPPNTHPIYRYSTSKRRAPKDVGSILKRVLKTHGLEKKLARYEFILQWKEIVGAEIAKRAKPEYLRGDTLIVLVESSIWAQELSFQKDIILRRLKRFSDFEGLNDIHFKIK